MKFEERRRRCIEFGLYMVQEQCTVRRVAEVKGISKSTVHKDLTVFLPIWDSGLYKSVRRVLDRNKAERHIRGGRATRKKLKGKKKK